MSLYCPHCERPLEVHDGGACKRRMSRRFFFGMLGGAVAASAMAKPLYESGVAIARAAERGLFNPRMDLKTLYDNAIRRIRGEAISDMNAMSEMNAMLDRWNATDIMLTPYTGDTLSREPVPFSLPCVIWPNRRRTDGAARAVSKATRRA